jgi:hypothetical protein
VARLRRATTKPKRELRRFALQLSFWFCVSHLSTGQKFNGVKKGLRIEMKVKDEVTQEIKPKTKNTFR